MIPIISQLIVYILWIYTAYLYKPALWLNLTMTVAMGITGGCVFANELWRNKR